MINCGDTINVNYFQKREKSCVLLRTLLSEEEAEAVSSLPSEATAVGLAGTQVSGS